ncbi:hypothetical protein DF056_26985 [Burkholderia cepacia]|uniref:hypothetical protein n=1 Tax=Burkholderia cepacia TaxID=292 RepID=UPI000F5ECF9B|nr:hypothetical protein [Burkholderia cepacia]RQZ76979.1 hypothetical protein DF056_26985 [Burkholderia cepacia]
MLLDELKKLEVFNCARYGLPLPAVQAWIARIALSKRGQCREGIPCALVLITSSAPATIATSSKPIDWMERPFYPAA